MSYIEFLPTAIFLIILGALIFKDRKNIEFHYVLLMRRTKKGKEWIYKIGDKYKKFFIVYSSIAIVVALIASIAGFFMILLEFMKDVQDPTQAKPSIGLFLPQLPGVTYPTPYIFSIPVLYWVISVISIMVPHELSHAFVARVEKIRIKSLGVLLLLIFPGAFVEPDENQLKKSRTLTKLRIYAAGTFGNFVVALVIFIVALAFAQLTSSMLKPVGVNYEVINGTPASEAGLSGTLLKVDGQSTPTISSFQRSMLKVKPGEVVNLETTNGNFKIKTISHPANANVSYVGVTNFKSEIEFQDSFKFLGTPSPLLIGTFEWFLGTPLFTSFKLEFFSAPNFGLFEWMFLLNLLVGLFNILPIKPLDGGLMYEEIFKVISKKNGVRMGNALSLITILLILSTVIITVTF